MTSSRKPVIVRKFSRDWVAGYAEMGWRGETRTLEILDTAGRVVSMGWDQVKWVCYLRELGVPEGGNPERLLQKKFSVRPRTPGLWLRLVLRDGDELEGIAVNDRSLIEGHGLLLIPPDTRSNTQRIFVPRAAIEAMEVVALIGAGRRRDPATGTGAQQPELFPAAPDERDEDGA
jgi:hypothetical protein